MYLVADGAIQAETETKVCYRIALGFHLTLRLLGSRLIDSPFHLTLHCICMTIILFLFQDPNNQSGVKPLNYFSRSGTFGEIGMQVNIPRTATCKAVENSLLYKFDSGMFIRCASLTFVSS